MAPVPLAVIRNFAIRYSSGLPPAPLAEQNKNIYRVSRRESVWKALKKPVADWYAETLRH